MKIAITILGLLLCFSSFGQIENQSTLSLEQIMEGEKFIGFQPDDIRWAEDNKSIYFSWERDSKGIVREHKVDIKSSQIDELSPEELRKESNSGDYSTDRKWKVYEKNGDLFLMNTSSLNITQITNTLSYEYGPNFNSDATHINYRKDDNLFAWCIEEGTTKQLTDFQSKNEDTEDTLSEQKEWLRKDQEETLNALEWRNELEDNRKEWKDQQNPQRPATIYLGDKSIGYISLSTNEKYVVYQLVDRGNDTGTKVPHYSTLSGYTEELDARSKVGDERNLYETRILNLETGMDYEVQIEVLDGIFNKPEYHKDYPERNEYWDTYDEPKEVYIGSPVFSKDGKAVVNVTSQDYKDRWIVLINLETGEFKQLDHQHDEAWIGGPEVGWFSRGKIEWIDNDNIWFKSEKTGFAHLYTCNVNSGDIKALTSGNFEILNTQLSKDKKTFYLTSNKKSPHEHHFYHLPVAGGEMKQITSEKGGHQVIVSPDEKNLAIRYSYTNTPWELYVMPNKAGSKMVKLTHSTTPEFEAYDWIDSEIVRFTASDGVEVPATLYKPKPENSNGAAVVFVHGAGYLQNVHTWWPGYYREYMFHNYLVDNGYTVLAIDFRASAGYGRDWRTAIYRNMGGRDLEDQIDGAKYLVEQHNIDPDRLGIYGGSYGGFITLMAMFKNPETFKSGAALRSVTDWAHYNHGYTANILNTPVEDSLAYKKSSPIYFAEGLEGNLLMLHGMIDTNVHFQDVVRLSQRLIELKKENWELAVYPIEGHGFRSPLSWHDEYRRIFELFQETLTSP